MQAFGTPEIIKNGPLIEYTGPDEFAQSRVFVVHNSMHATQADALDEIDRITAGKVGIIHRGKPWVERCDGGFRARARFCYLKEV